MLSGETEDVASSYCTLRRLAPANRPINQHVHVDIHESRCRAVSVLSQWFRGGRGGRGDTRASTVLKKRC